jgi:hypothetical protein
VESEGERSCITYSTLFEFDNAINSRKSFCSLIVPFVVALDELQENFDPLRGR